MYEELIGELHIVASGVQSKRRRELLEKAADAIENISKAYQMMAEAYEAEVTKQDWIPVTEQLPENDDDVLCYYEYYHWSKEKVMPEYGIGHCWNGRWGGEVANGRECKVLAWMPLPEPPKEET